jgi:hypothetical protein
MPHLAIGFFFLRRNKYKIAKVRYFPGKKLYIKAFSSFFLLYYVFYNNKQTSLFMPFVSEALQKTIQNLCNKNEAL